MVHTPLYLSGVRNRLTDALASYHDSDLPLGLLIQPLTKSYLTASHLYQCVGIDNGCFTKIGQARFKLPDYLDLAREALQRWGDYCLFVTAPDVAFDWGKTLAASLPVLPKIRAIGAPAALVVQDGATVANVPWDDFDVLFIGGSTEWKVGADAMALSRAMMRRHGWTHMGRVNSMKRMLRAQDMHVDSVDGTHLLYQEEDVGVENILSWLRATQRRAIQAALSSVTPRRNPIRRLIAQRRLGNVC